MKLVSFNIRCDHGQDGINNFCHRQDLIVRVIQREKPDLIGFQEMLPHMRSRLEESLGQAYLFVGCGRGKDLGDESMSVALRKDRLELVNLDVFWLSETPGVPGSRFKEQSDCPRLCTHVLVHALGDGRLLHVYNTHLDHISSRARQLGLALEEETALPTVLINDGRVLTKNLRRCGRDEAWLRKALREQGFSRPEEVFLLTYAPECGVFCLGKEDAK